MNNPAPDSGHKPYQPYLAHIYWDAYSITDLLAMWRLVRDVCRRYGFEDWKDMYFSMELTFSSTNSPRPESLLAAARDLDLPITVTEQRE